MARGRWRVGEFDDLLGSVWFRRYSGTGNALALQLLSRAAFFLIDVDEDVGRPPDLLLGGEIGLAVRWKYPPRTLMPYLPNSLVMSCGAFAESLLTNDGTDSLQIVVDVFATLGIEDCWRIEVRNRTCAALGQFGGFAPMICGCPFGGKRSGTFTDRNSRARAVGFAVERLCTKN